MLNKIYSMIKMAEIQQIMSIIFKTYTISIHYN
jgi:hypothetical protein